MNSKRSGKGGVEGILSGLTQLMEKLNELAETGKELHEQKAFTSESGLKGVYGINVRVGLGDDKDKVSVEPFGNIRKDKKSGRTVVQEVIEPVVDVFDEDDHALVLAEMPGVALHDVRLELHDDLLSIVAENPRKKYHKELLLPRAYTREQLQMSCNNGILEIRCG